MIALSVDGLGVRFGGLRAVDDVSFELVEGRSTALVGPNGAGKTTVFNLMTGFIKPTAGRVMRNGNDLVGLAPDRVAQLGIGLRPPARSRTECRGNGSCSGVAQLRRSGQQAGSPGR